jgi:hypothetical protein
MHVDLTGPTKLYRYAEGKWLAQAVKYGEFRLRSATDYFPAESLSERHDNGLVRVRTSPSEHIQVFMAGRTEPR